MITFSNFFFCTFSYRFLDYPEWLFDVILSLGIIAVFDGQNLEAKKIMREKRERLGVKSTSSHRGSIHRDYTLSSTY